MRFNFKTLLMVLADLRKLDIDAIKKTKDGLVVCQELSKMLSYRYDTKNLVSTRFTA